LAKKLVGVHWDLGAFFLRSFCSLNGREVDHEVEEFPPNTVGLRFALEITNGTRGTCDFEIESDLPDSVPRSASSGLEVKFKFNDGSESAEWRRPFASVTSNEIRSYSVPIRFLLYGGGTVNIRTLSLSYRIVSNFKGEPSRLSPVQDFSPKSLALRLK
jgi:hypothetical protein